MDMIVSFVQEVGIEPCLMTLGYLIMWWAL